MQKGEYKYFKPHDIIIYALVLVLFMLSCVFVTTSRGDSGERFELLYKGEVILKADFDGFSEYNENYVAKKKRKRVRNCNRAREKPLENRFYFAKCKVHGSRLSRRRVFGYEP